MALVLTYPAGGALVTGGTGRLGEGIVRQFAKAGVPLVFTYRGSEGLARALEAEMQGAGHQVIAVRMDAEDSASIDAALARVVSEFGRLHTVAVGGGVPVTFSRMADFPVETIEKFIAGDAIGYFRLFKAAIAIMRGSGGGSIVGCSSVATKRVIEFDGISPFSKGALDALVRQLAYEEAENGIRVNAVAIGWVDKLTRDETRQYVPEGRPDKCETQMDMTRAIVDQMEGLVRFHRPGTQEEGGNLVAFLASDQASFLTGQIIDFDGGAVL